MPASARRRKGRNRGSRARGRAAPTCPPAAPGTYPEGARRSHVVPGSPSCCSLEVAQEPEESCALMVDPVQGCLELIRFGGDVQAWRSVHKCLEVCQRLTRLEEIRQTFLMVRHVRIRQTVDRDLPVDLDRRELLVQTTEEAGLHL